MAEHKAKKASIATQAPQKKSLFLRCKQFIVRHRLQIGIFLVAFTIFIFRRPDAITNPQFWAEDGALWFHDPVDNGFLLKDIFTPYSGYLTVFQRLVGEVAAAFPVSYGPLIFNLVAIGVAALVPVYLLSDRVRFISLRHKLLLIAAYIVLPYTAEIHANITNTQWYLSLLLFLYIFMEPAKSLYLRYGERIFIAILSVTGPFSVLLTPVVLFEIYLRKKIRIEDIIILSCALIQILFLLLTRPTPEGIKLGYSVGTFLQIFSGQVIGGGLFGYKALSWVYFKPWIAPVMAVISLELLVYVFVKSNRYFRYFLYLGTVILLSALKSPFGNGIPGETWWSIFTTYGFGGRYYFILHIGVIIALGWLVFSRQNKLLYAKVFAIIVVALAIVLGVPKDFHHEAYRDLHYQTYAKQYESAPKGKPIKVPLNPGEPWNMVLVKQ